MKQFSHSKLQVYERCPLQYKLQYLTNLKPEREDTIEAFMGSRVHDTLELLYRDLQKTKLNSLEELFKFYEDIWLVEWMDDIVINNKAFKKEHYFDSGKKCIRNYYEKYQPFNQDHSIAMEKKIKLKWGEYEIIGYIDRLAREERGVYVIHDYKTGGMMEQEYADKDRQLALYSIAVKQNFKEAKEVKLIWHFVAVGEDVVSRRTNAQLQDLKKDILKTIRTIEEAEKNDCFPAIENKCEWCGYWKYCPKKKHLFMLEKIPKNKYLKDSGVKLAVKYIDLANQKSEANRIAREVVVKINSEMEKVEDAILQYAKKHKSDVLHGGEYEVNINRSEGYAFPLKSSDMEKYVALEQLLLESKYWSSVSQIATGKLENLLDDDQLDPKLKKKILKLAEYRKEIKLSVRKSKTIE